MAAPSMTLPPDISLDTHNPLKRVASASFDANFAAGTSRKRIRFESSNQFHTSVEQEVNDKTLLQSDQSVPDSCPSPPPTPDKGKGREISLSKQILLSEYLFEELKCGCCTELCYNPVLIIPCQHFFCGSCCTMWFRHGGRDCPQCRTAVAVVVPARPIQSITDTLLKAFPNKARSDRDKLQADDIYTAGTSIRLPPPRVPTPEPNVSSSQTFVRPCPHCAANNEFGWTCPIPIVDPTADPGNAWHVDNGCPVGHAWCGSCDSLHAPQAPTSQKCDLCFTSFCGLGVTRHCSILTLLSQEPEGLIELQDLILCEEIVEIFQRNVVEVEYLFDYLQLKAISPTRVYREIASHILSEPNQFSPLIEEGLFNDMYSHTAIQSNTSQQLAPERICRRCSAEIFLWGLKDWWLRERQSGSISPNILARPDCSSGSTCARQGEPSHAREFNHIIAATRPPSLLSHSATEPTQSDSVLPSPLGVQTSVVI